jgi:hypothetical protein
MGFVSWVERKQGRLSPEEEAWLKTSDVHNAGGWSGYAMGMIVPGPGKLGVAGKSLKHIAKHLPEFRALNPRATLRAVVKIGQKISSNPNNLIGTPGGRQVFQQTVNIGGNPVTVRAVLNPNGGLRSVHIRR